MLNVNGWLGRLNTPLSELIQKQQPDIACIQEAFAPKTKALNNFQDQYNYIDELMEIGQFNHFFFAPAFGFKMGGAILQEGNIILSKHSLSGTKSFHIYGKYYIKASGDNTRLHARVLQSCSLQIPGGGKIIVANYQGYLAGTDSIGDDVTVTTIRTLSDALKSLNRPLIFCADLNISKESSAFRPMADLGLRDLTTENNIKTTLSQVHRASEKDRNSVACDFIFVSSEIKVNSFSVLEEIVSDHKALILDFDI